MEKGKQVAPLSSIKLTSEATKALEELQETYLKGHQLTQVISSALVQTRDSKCV